MTHSPMGKAERHAHIVAVLLGTLWISVCALVVWFVATQPFEEPDPCARMLLFDPDPEDLSRDTVLCREQRRREP